MEEKRAREAAEQAEFATARRARLCEACVEALLEGIFFACCYAFAVARLYYIIGDERGKFVRCYGEGQRCVRFGSPRRAWSTPLLRVRCPWLMVRPPKAIRLCPVQDSQKRPIRRACCTALGCWEIDGRVII